MEKVSTPSVIRTAVLVPGIMGSTLSYSSGGTTSTIWSDNFSRNYKLLLSNPALLRWNGIPAAGTVIAQVSVTKTPFTFVVADLWGATLNYLRTHSEFGDTSVGGTRAFGYDWRQSLLASAADLGRFVNSRKAALTAAAKSGPPQIKFVFIAHSMGGLLMRIALANGHIAPSDVDRIITVGSPFRGAPQAFHAAYQTGNLPMLKTLSTVFNWANSDTFFAHLLNNIQSFPSIYQLMPPTGYNYLYYSAAQTANPLDEHFVPQQFRQEATNAHNAVLAGEQAITKSGIKAFAIFTDLHNKEDSVVYVRPRGIRQDEGYEIIEVIGRTEYGDGTVTSESARGGTAARQIAVLNVTHAYMCNHSRVVNLLQTIL